MNIDIKVKGITAGQNNQILNKEDFKAMISYYNETADDFNKLNISVWRAPIIDLNASITVEQLQVFQISISSKLIQELNYAREVISEYEEEEEAE